MITAMASHPHRGARCAARQQLLVLYLSNGDLGGRVTAWAFHDGTTTEAVPLEDVPDEPPYTTGLDALRDGWRMISWPTLLPHGEEPYDLNYLPHEYVFEKVIGAQS